MRPLGGRLDESEMLGSTPYSYYGGNEHFMDRFLDDLLTLFVFKHCKNKTNTDPRANKLRLEESFFFFLSS